MFKFSRTVSLPSIVLLGITLALEPVPLPLMLPKLRATQHQWRLNRLTRWLNPSNCLPNDMVVLADIESALIKVSAP